MNNLILKIELLPTADFLITLQDLKALQGIDSDKAIKEIIEIETTTNKYSLCYWEVLLNNKKMNKRGIYV